MWLHMLDVWPGYRFDGEDQVFYLTGDNTEHDTCMIRLKGGDVSPDSNRMEVDFECVFFGIGWSSTKHSNPPLCTVIDYGSVALVLPEFRADACGWDFHRKYVLERVIFHGIPRTSSVVIHGRTSRVRVSFTLAPTSDRNICSGAF